VIKLIYCIIVGIFISQSAYSWVFTRRTDQFKKQSSYAILPIPYSIPGLGSGIGVAGGFNNVLDTYIDAYALAIAGDVEGRAIGITDIHLLEKRLIFDMGYSEISKAAFSINYSRGMEGDEDPEEFNTAEISDSGYMGGMLTLTFAERMIEMSYRRYIGRAKMERIRDKDGNVLLEVENPEAEEQTIILGEFVFDFTDDRHDPRAGFRYNYSRNFPESPEEGSPHYYSVDLNATLYIPVLANSTFVTNYFQSDSYMIKLGETDRDIIAANADLEACETGDTECEEARENYIDLIEASNRYGNASSLGGLSRLRSFTMMRYRGAHTRFYGAELRWNLTDEKTTFDILFMKDLRTSIQLAFYHEMGTIADKTEDLFEETRHSTGVGVRAVMGSGLVYRLDVATGEEGVGFVLFLGYPWDIF
jgi:Omp85 superfamily domain